MRMIVKMDNCEFSFCLKENDFIAINYFVADGGFHFKYLPVIAFFGVHNCYKISLVIFIT